MNLPSNHGSNYCQNSNFTYWQKQKIRPLAGYVTGNPAKMSETDLNNYAFAIIDIASDGSLNIDAILDQSDDVKYDNYVQFGQVSFNHTNNIDMVFLVPKNLDKLTIYNIINGIGTGNKEIKIAAHGQPKILNQLIFTNNDFKQPKQILIKGILNGDDIALAYTSNYDKNIDNWAIHKYETHDAGGTLELVLQSDISVLYIEILKNTTNNITAFINNIDIDVKELQP